MKTRERISPKKKTKTNNEIAGAQKAPSANVAPLLPNEVVTNSSTALRTSSIPNCRSCTKAKKKCNKNGKGSTNPDCAFWNPLKDLRKTKKNTEAQKIVNACNKFVCSACKLADRADRCNGHFCKFGSRGVEKSP